MAKNKPYKIPPANIKVATKYNEDEGLFIKAKAMIDIMEKDLIFVLTNPDKEVFASEYIQERLEMWEQFCKEITDKYEDD